MLLQFLDGRFQRSNSLLSFGQLPLQLDQQLDESFGLHPSLSHLLFELFYVHAGNPILGDLAEGVRAPTLWLPDRPPVLMLEARPRTGPADPIFCLLSTSLSPKILWLPVKGEPGKRLGFLNIRPLARGRSRIQGRPFPGIEPTVRFAGVG